MAVEADVVDDRALSESMDEDIRKTLGEITARNASESVTIEGEATRVEEPVPGTPVADTRARDASGKFIATEQTAAPETVSQPSSATETTAPVAAAPTDTPAIDLNRPPSSWKPAAKAQWAALTPEVRAEIYRREGDFHNGNRALKDNADFGQQVRTKFEPYKMLMQAEGSTPEQGIDEYLRTAALFRVGTPQQKMGMMYQIDKQFNCGFEQEFQRLVAAEVARVTGQPVQQPVQQQPQQFHDPRVDQLLQSQEQEQQRRAQQLASEANDAENKFRAAMDDKGQPKYPFVDNVEQDMINRIPELRRLNPALSQVAILEQAYDAAVWANPETRAVLISQQQAQAAQPVETQRKVEAARRASAVNVPRRGALPATGPAKSMEEDIRETGRALGMF